MEVHGDFMSDAGILHRDQVIAQCCHDAENGDVVIALTPDSAMAGILCQEEGRVCLKPMAKL